MKKILIIDDEPLARSIVKEYLEDYSDLEIVGECGDGFEAVKSISTLKPDLIFLDIQMPKINGFEVLEIINEKPAIIFTSAFDEFALKAFETNSLDYLLKPFSKERFDSAINKWRNTLNVQNDKLDKLNESTFKQPDEQLRVVIKDNQEIIIIPTSEIEYFEAYDDYIKIHHKGKVHLKKKTMNYFEQTLNPKQFIRIHRSFLLNINELTRIETFEKNSYIAILKSGKRIPISRSAYAPLKESLGI